MAPWRPCSYLFRRFDRPLAGALVAGGWSVGALAISYGYHRRLNVFAGLAATVAVIEVIGAIITRNPNVYLAAAAIDRTLYGILFLGSLLRPRPLIQVIAEATSGQIGSAAFRRTPLYRSAWRLLTALWGIVNVLSALGLVLAQLWLPLETFLVCGSSLACRWW